MPRYLKFSGKLKIPNKYDISKRLLIIDNNPTFIDYTENLLICPSYNYMKFYDLRETLPNNHKCEDLKRYIDRLIKEKRISKISNKTTENLEKLLEEMKAKEEQERQVREAERERKLKELEERLKNKK